MADWNLTPAWVPITEIYAQKFTKIVGATDDIFNKIVENMQFLYNNIGGANVAVGNVTTETLENGFLADVEVTDRKDPVRDWTYLDFKFQIPRGPKGDTGLTPDLRIGQVTAGEDAQATITGTAEEPILNLTLPRGEQGYPVWVRYATDAQGNDMVATPSEGTKFIGFYVGTAPSAAPTAYTWSKYVGKQPISIAIEGTSFVITWDDGSASEVAIDVAQCATAEPVPGIVTSVDGKDGAVTTEHVYDVVIKTQEEFDALIADSTWFGAQSVLFDGKSVAFEAHQSISVPENVRIIDGTNNARLYFYANASAPYNRCLSPANSWNNNVGAFGTCRLANLTIAAVSAGTVISSFRNVQNCVILMMCTGNSLADVPVAVRACQNISNCMIQIQYAEGVTVQECRGFYACDDLENCRVDFTGTSGTCYGGCVRLTNCSVATSDGVYAFENCKMLTNCSQLTIAPGITERAVFMSCVGLSACRGTFNRCVSVSSSCVSV